MEIKRGATRTVFLLGGLAFKFPTFYSWENFLYGLLGNMQETRFSQLGWEQLCPVVFSINFGLLVVMKRAMLLTDIEFSNMNYNDFIKVGVPVENKQCSFGWLNGRIVAVDYGS